MVFKLETLTDWTIGQFLFHLFALEVGMILMKPILGVFVKGEDSESSVR